MKLDKRLLLIPFTIGALLVGAVGPGFAYSAWQAAQTGFTQSGTAVASNLTINVEAGLDPDGTLLPDPYYGCYPGPCPGGALTFAIENKSSVPLRVQSVTQRTRTCGSNETAPCYVNITTDKNNDGTWIGYMAYSTTSCASHASFTPPHAVPSQGGDRGWPTIPPHTVLHVNGSDGLALGAGLFHLDSSTPTGCMGAMFSVPLTVNATDQS